MSEGSHEQDEVYACMHVCGVYASMCVYVSFWSGNNY